MSLKTFHIVFIVLSVALTLGFGVWAFAAGVTGSDATLIRMLGVISFICCAGLLVYGICFFKKLARLKTT